MCVIFEQWPGLVAGRKEETHLPFERSCCHFCVPGSWEVTPESTSRPTDGQVQMLQAQGPMGARAAWLHGKQGIWVGQNGPRKVPSRRMGIQLTWNNRARMEYRRGSQHRLRTRIISGAKVIHLFLMSTPEQLNQDLWRWGHPTSPGKIFFFKLPTWF